MIELAMLSVDLSLAVETQVFVLLAVVVSSSTTFDGADESNLIFFPLALNDVNIRDLIFF